MKLFLGFRFQVIVRLFLIFALGIGATYILIYTYFWLVSIWLFLFMTIAIMQLIKFVENHKRKLTNFLIAIQQHDFSNSYTYSTYNKHDELLNQAFQAITTSFQALRKEKESNYHFLQAVVEHTTVPTIGYLVDSGKVTLLNAAAKSLLGKEHLSNIQLLYHIDQALLNTIQKLQSGERSLVKATIDQTFYNLSLSVKELKLEDQEYKLVALQDIKAELEEKELEAWQKLIRILTHEIKNSAIPISTLTEVITQLLTTQNGELKNLETLNNEDKEDLLLGLKTVKKRSKGLVKFVNAYGELSRIPEPQINQLAVKPLIEHVIALFKNELQKQRIQLNVQLDNANIQADPELIEQVLINLMKNAVEAVKEIKSPQITICSHSKGKQTIVSIEDNGPGIPPEVIEQIFIPFYTTKTNGSGIGLSLSKQVMRAHKGDLKVDTQNSSGTRFYLHF